MGLKEIGLKEVGWLVRWLGGLNKSVCIPHQNSWEAVYGEWDNELIEYTSYQAHGFHVMKSLEFGGTPLH
jgi:hypothetical protein